MNCIDHNDRSAVTTCAKCGAGLCNDCITGSAFKDDNNQPFCKKCNYEFACENDRIFHSTLKSKQIIMYIYLAAVVIGVGLFIKYQIQYEGKSPVASALTMLLCWAFGSIANIFDRDSGIRYFFRKLGESLKKVISTGTLLQRLFGLLWVAIGSIFGFTFMGVFSPIMVIMCLIGIGKVKKQIASNNKILSQLQAGNSQQQS